MKRAALRTASARRPLARTSGYQACNWGCVGGLGVLEMRYNCCPTQGAVELSAFPNYAGPQHLCLCGVLRVGAGIRAG
jgi:hypothetical protein